MVLLPVGHSLPKSLTWDNGNESLARDRVSKAKAFQVDIGGRMFKIGETVAVTTYDDWHEFYGQVCKVTHSPDLHGHYIVNNEFIRKHFKTGIYVTEQGIRKLTKLEKALL